MNPLIYKIQKALKQGNLFDKILLQIGISTGYSNTELFPVQERYKQYLRMKRKYGKFEKKYSLRSCENPKIVWICWLQGIENAPNIVKVCYESVISNFKDDWKVVVLTEENIFEYISMPEYIIKKWKKGIITNTHFSDLLRMEILIKYGGLWSDATVFYTNPIPAYIYDTPFFTYHHSFRYDVAVVFESWFIYSVANHPLLLETRDMIYKYWKDNNRLNEYFLFHLFFTIATEIYPEYWNSVPVFSDIIPHILASELFNNYEEERFNQIKEMTSVHKLSYKLNEDKKRKKNTFYYKIVADRINNYEDK